MNPTLDTMIHELANASRTPGTRRRSQAPNLPRHRAGGHPRPVQTLRASALPGDPTAMGAALAAHDDSRHHEGALLAALAGEEGYRRAPGDAGTIAALRGVQQLLRIAREEGRTDPAVDSAQLWVDRTTSEVGQLLDHDVEVRPLTPLRCTCGRRYTLSPGWRSAHEPSLSCPCGRELSYAQWSAVLAVFADLRPASAIEHQLSLPATEVHRLRAAGYVEHRDKESGAQLFSLREVQQALLTLSATRSARPASMTRTPSC